LNRGHAGSADLEKRSEVDVEDENDEDGDTDDDFYDAEDGDDD
jgi:hypothetical protein